MKKIKALEGTGDACPARGAKPCRMVNLTINDGLFVTGLTNSVDEFRRHKPAKTAKDATDLVMLIQYFKSLKEIGISTRTNATVNR